MAPSAIRRQGENFEPRRAFKLALRELRGQLRIDAALAGLAKVVRPHRDFEPARRIRARAGLLDEQRANRGLALGRGLRYAIPRHIDTVARRHESTEQIGALALLLIGLDDVVAMLGPRIGHEADGSQHAAIVEQRRYDQRKARLAGPGPARDLVGKVAGTRNVLVLVVVLEIDFAQAARLRRAAGEIAPAAQLPVRRAAVRPAGEAAKLL